MSINDQNKNRDFKIKQRGKLGERYVGDYLSERGYSIVTNNFSCQYGEIDVIAQKDSIIAFVEVKTRTSGSMTGGLESITKSKIKKILKTAAFYLMKNNIILQPRIDCAEVIVNEYDNRLVNITYIENAVEQGGMYAPF